MALTYTQLVADKDTDGSIKSWVNYANIPATTVLTQAEAYLYERLRVREMRVEGAVSIAADDDSMAVPSGFLDPIMLLLDGDSEPIEYLHENLIRRYRDEDGNLEEGTIGAYTIVNEYLLFDVKSSEARTGYLWYYKTPTALGAGNTTNFLTTRYPQLLTDACLAFAYGFRKDFQARNEYLAIAKVSIDQANEAAEMGRRGQTLR